MTDLYKPDSYFDFTALRDRVWTTRLIQRSFKEADQLQRVYGLQSGRPQRLYSANRVAHIEESDPNFIAEKRRANCTHPGLKGGQGVKKKNLVAMVEAMALQDLELQIEKILQHAEKKRDDDQIPCLRQKNGLRFKVCWLAWVHLHVDWKYFKGMQGYGTHVFCR